MSKLVAELFRRFLLPLANLAAVDHHIVVAGDAIDRMEPKENLSKRTGNSQHHALFFDVMTVKADQRCSTFLLPHFGHTTWPFS
jgi:hypothetical protein